MIPDFGVGIKRALFENVTQELLNAIEIRMVEQLELFAPYIDILQLFVVPINDHTITIKLK